LNIGKFITEAYTCVLLSSGVAELSSTSIIAYRL